MIKPSTLKIQNTIALVNPGGTLPKRFIRQIDYIEDYLKRQRFNVKKFLSSNNDPTDIALQFNSAFKDPNISAVLPICGGKTVRDVLEKIDYDLISNNPKIFCGSSELSILSVLINTRTGLITFYGPHLNFINDRSSKRENLFSVGSFWNMLMWQRIRKNGLKTHEKYSIFQAPLHDPILIRDIYRYHERITKKSWQDNLFINIYGKYSQLSGLTIISSLESLVYLAETKIDVDYSGKLVFVDTLDSSHAEIIRQIKHLIRKTNIKNCASFIISSVCERTDRQYPLFPTLNSKREIKLFLEQIDKLFSGLIPILYGFPLGHCAYKLTLPIGSMATINTINGDILLHNKPFL